MFYKHASVSILIPSTFEQMDPNMCNQHKHIATEHPGVNQVRIYEDQLKTRLKICGLTWKSIQFIQEGFKGSKPKDEFGQKSYQFVLST